MDHCLNYLEALITQLGFNSLIEQWTIKDEHLVKQEQPLRHQGYLGDQSNNARLVPNSHARENSPSHVIRASSLPNRMQVRNQYPKKLNFELLFESKIAWRLMETLEGWSQLKYLSFSHMASNINHNLKPVDASSADNSPGCQQSPICKSNASERVSFMSNSVSSNIFEEINDTPGTKLNMLYQSAQQLFQYLNYYWEICLGCSLDDYLTGEYSMTSSQKAHSNDVNLAEAIFGHRTEGVQAQQQHKAIRLVIQTLLVSQGATKYLEPMVQLSVEAQTYFMELVTSFDRYKQQNNRNKQASPPFNGVANRPNLPSSQKSALDNAFKQSSPIITPSQSPARKDKKPEQSRGVVLQKIGGSSPGAVLILQNLNASRSSGPPTGLVTPSPQQFQGPSSHRSNLQVQTDRILLTRCLSQSKDLETLLGVISDLTYEKMELKSRVQALSARLLLRQRQWDQHLSQINGTPQRLNGTHSPRQSSERKSRLNWNFGEETYKEMEIHYSIMLEASNTKIDKLLKIVANLQHELRIAKETIVIYEKTEDMSSELKSRVSNYQLELINMKTINEQLENQLGHQTEALTSLGEQYKRLQYAFDRKTSELEALSYQSPSGTPSRRRNLRQAYSNQKSNESQSNSQRKGTLSAELEVSLLKQQIQFLKRENSELKQSLFNADNRRREQSRTMFEGLWKVKKGMDQVVKDTSRKNLPRRLDRNGKENTAQNKGEIVSSKEEVVV